MVICSSTIMSDVQGYVSTANQRNISMSQGKGEWEWFFESSRLNQEKGMRDCRHVELQQWPALGNGLNQHSTY
jgi:hypothetical protein